MLKIAIYFRVPFIFLLTVFYCTVGLADGKSCAANEQYLVGAGIYDITGPAAERGMMGYAQIDQKTSGILQRDWARAFIIKSPCNGKEVVFVNADLAMLFQGVQQEVLRQLHARFGNEYTAQNVVLSAIHQHSGPGGYASHALYNLTTLGFDKMNFANICRGIVESIVRARANMQPASISIAQGQLTNASVNRSPSAYLLDPASERQRYAHNRDTTMTLIKFVAKNGHPLGLINWFPVHGTSLDNTNTLISGDNKGYAAYLFEKDYHSTHGPKDFVAAFAQANAGDVSPNLDGKGGGHGAAGRADVEDIGGKQYRKAKSLFASAITPIIGPVDFRQQYVDMRNVKIDDRYTTPALNKTTCPAAIGNSMLAGTSDGPGYGQQGVRNCTQIKSILPRIACHVMTIKTACQGVKPIVLQTNIQQPPWTATVLPFSIIRVGSLAMVVSPFELTTMSGRRIREMVARDMRPLGIRYVVIAGYSNAYAGYVTTAQEYQAQRYEGASDLFGPWSLNAQMQIYNGLATAMLEDRPAPKSDKVPNVLAWHQTDLQTGVAFDAPPIGRQYGEVDVPPAKHYRPGQTVTVKFFGAHPKNNFRTMSTFLLVQHYTHKGWVNIADDNDWDTTYHWQRLGVAASVVTIRWRIPKKQSRGYYRILYFGNAKSVSGKISPITGNSGDFLID